MVVDTVGWEAETVEPCWRTWTSTRRKIAWRDSSDSLTTMTTELQSFSIPESAQTDRMSLAPWGLHEVVPACSSSPCWWEVVGLREKFVAKKIEDILDSWSFGEVETTKVVLMAAVVAELVDYERTTKSVELLLVDDDAWFLEPGLWDETADRSCLQMVH